MAWPTSNFPTSLDSITDKSDTTDDVAAADINGAYDCIEKMEAKIGVDSSAVTTSLDYLVKNVASSNPGHKHTLAAGATDVTASKDELNLLDGSSAGTAVASKALVLGADKNVDTIAIADGGLKLGSGAGTAVTSTASELNLLDNMTASIMTEGFRNLSFTATVSGKALTISLKGEDGNAPSATNKVQIKFRSATLTDSKPVLREATGATTIALSSGSTLGFTAAEAGRLYVWAIDNAGTVELAVSRTANIFPESNLVSTTAEGGAGAADSASVMYSTTALTNKAVKCIGYIEITTGATAGEWDNAPTKIQVMAPGVKRTGDIVQIAKYQTGEVVTGSTAIPHDDTIPQNTEGVEVFTLSITPQASANALIIDVVLDVYTNASGNLAVALFQDSNANALAVNNIYCTTSMSQTLHLKHKMTAGTTSATTFKVRVGTSGGATITMNGVGGSRYYGGVAASSITITEVAA